MPVIKNTGYMISPLELTERQLLIYRKLYEKCNFRDMTVSYTAEQLVCDIKIIELTEKIIRNELSKFIEKGYLIRLERGGNGKPSLFQIVKNVDLCGNLSVTYGELNGNLKTSNTSGLNSAKESNREVNSNLKGTPIKEKRKRKSNISSSNDNWKIEAENLWKLYPRKEGKQKAFEKIPSLLEKYGHEQLERCIERYKLTKKFRDGYIQQGSTFFSSGYFDYLDENYEEVETSKEDPTDVANDFIEELYK